MDTVTSPLNAAAPELAPELRPSTPAPPRSPSPQELLEAQYQGPKSALRPLYDALFLIAKKVGGGTRATPNPMAVVFERKGIPFAVVKVGPKNRLDLGLALPEMKPHSPWKTARRFGGVERITHRLELASRSDIDGLLVQWMAEAYALATPPKPARPMPPKKSGRTSPGADGRRPLAGRS